MAITVLTPSFVGLLNIQCIYFSPHRSLKSCDSTGPIHSRDLCTKKWIYSRNPEDLKDHKLHCWFADDVTVARLINNYSSSPTGLWVNIFLLRRHEGERNNCFCKIQLVGQKYRDKRTLASKTWFSRHFFGFQSRRFSLLEDYNVLPSSSFTNQNAALIIDHQFDITNWKYPL